MIHYRNSLNHISFIKFGRERIVNTMKSRIHKDRHLLNYNQAIKISEIFKVLRFPTTPESILLEAMTKEDVERLIISEPSPTYDINVVF